MKNLFDKLDCDITPKTKVFDVDGNMIAIVVISTSDYISLSNGDIVDADCFYMENDKLVVEM